MLIRHTCWHLLTFFHRSSQEVAGLHHMREVTGALAGILAATIVALAIMIWLFLRLRRRYRRTLRELERYKSAGPAGSGGLEQVMTEKPRAQPGNRAQHSTVDLMDTNSDYDLAFELITPTADGLRNPFDDSSSITAGGLRPGKHTRLLPQHHDKNRLSTTSLVSDVPSAGARSAGAHSAFSTEFYHRAQTRTVPLRRVVNGSAADSDSASGTYSMSGASSADDGSVQTVLVPITRVSTTSSGSRGYTTSEDADDARSFSNISYTEPESLADSEDFRRTRSRQTDDSRETASSGFSAWGRRLVSRS